MLENAKYSLLDSLLRAVLKIIWEPFSKKQSYFWNWEIFLKEVEYTVNVSKDGTVTDRNSFWRNFCQSNFGWRRIEILKPITWSYENWEGDYLIGFYNNDERVDEICWLKLNGPVAVLAGDKDTKFFAFDAKCMKPLKLKSFGVTTKKRFGKYKIKHNIPKTPLI